MKKNISIGNKYIGEGSPAFIIAEAGLNHNGSIKLAKKMIDIAKLSGSDAVKFQTFKTEDLMAKKDAKFKMLKQLELSEKDFKTLRDYCKDKGIIFLSTPFDSKSAEFLYELGVPLFKISSGELTNTPLLTQIARYKKPIILSTGMSTLKEVKEAIKVIYLTGNKKLVLLHCTSNYPARFEDVNLKAIETLRKVFNVPVGYSDHTKGVHISGASIVMGACVIEKHFTLNRNFLGPDHKSSLEPEELQVMVKNIRDIEKSIGDGVKISVKSEDEIKKIARKSIVANMDIKKGVILTENMIALKRPGIGIGPKYLNKIIGKRLRSSVEKDRMFTWDLIR